MILGSELSCDKGEFENKFEVSPKNIKLQGYHVASQADNVAGKHIKSFGSCSAMGTCKMESDLYGQFLIWFETYSRVRFAGSEALLEDSYCFCPYGGKITVSDSKQIDYASAMAELFGDFADTVEQMKEGIEDLSDMAVKSLIGMFDGAMTEYYTNEENRLRDSVRDMERNNTGNSYMYMQTGYNPREELAQLQRSKAIYEANNWQDIKNVNLKDVYAKMQENPNKVDLGPRKISGLMALTNPLFAAGYYVETKVRNIRSVLPDMTIGDFFSRGTSKEGITELWTKGMDCQNKKMLPGMLGYHPLQAAYAGGYTNYDPMESMQIVDSMSDDGKAAYMLRKTANEGLSAYNELYGYYQMSKALDMAGKGKVKTGSKPNNENLDFRKKNRTNSKGETIARRKAIRDYKKYWRSRGIKVKTDRKGNVLKSNADAGFDYDKGIIYLRKKPTVISMAHEGYHTKQWIKLGKSDYLKLTSLQREEFVYEQIIKNSYRFDAASLEHSRSYIEDLRFLEKMKNQYK